MELSVARVTVILSKERRAFDQITHFWEVFLRMDSADNEQ